jgi:hypothetical protein
MEPSFCNRLTVDVHFHKPFAVIFHPLAEIAEVSRMRRIRPENFRHRA